MTDFCGQLRKIIMRYKRIGYSLNVMRQFACLVINPITVDGYATSEYHMRGYNKGGSNENGKTSIVEVSHDYVKKQHCARKKVCFLESVIFLILTSFCSRTLYSQDKHLLVTPSPLCI